MALDPRSNYNPETYEILFQKTINGETIELTYPKKVSPTQRGFLKIVISFQTEDDKTRFAWTTLTVRAATGLHVYLTRWLEGDILRLHKTGPDKNNSILSRDSAITESEDDYRKEIRVIMAETEKYSQKNACTSIDYEQSVQICKFLEGFITDYGDNASNLKLLVTEALENNREVFDEIDELREKIEELEQCVNKILENSKVEA